MYSPNIVEKSLHDLRVRGHRVQQFPVERCFEQAEELDRIWDAEKGRLRRQLTPGEQSFIINESLVCEADWRYWATRYARIKGEAPGDLPRFAHLWESQEMTLRFVGRLQETSHARRDGILIANLKARQLGVSTVYELMLAHRAFFTRGFLGLLAADTPDQSEYLFNMMERAYTHLPWWLRPHREFHVKGTQMWFDKLDSLILVDHGNKRSEILDRDVGRGKTIHGLHLSELEKWVNWSQIHDGLMPAVPMHPDVVVFFESTGEFLDSEWYNFFMACLHGENARFEAFFIPWYAEPGKYSRPAPADWSPDELTQRHAASIEVDSPRWMEGRTYRPSRDQLYWWERTRNQHAKSGKLGVFYSEYASTPEEAFRSYNISVFDHETIEWLRSRLSYPAAWELWGPNYATEKIRLEQARAAASVAGVRQADKAGLL